MKELNDIEDLFVREVLDTHGEYMLQLMEDSITEKNIRLTDELLDSLAYNVEKRNGDYVLSLSFVDHGRFVEIGYFKSKKMRREATLDGKGSKQLRRKGQKDTRFYAKNVYGSINRLLGRMSSEYSDAEIARLKTILENRDSLPVNVKNAMGYV